MSVISLFMVFGIGNGLVQRPGYCIIFELKETRTFFHNSKIISNSRIRGDNRMVVDY